MSTLLYKLYKAPYSYAKNSTKKRIVLVIIPKPIKGPSIPVFRNLKKLNFTFLDFSIKNQLLSLNYAKVLIKARKIDIEKCSFYLIIRNI
tara:strand:+ start:329 stop:598 length:270 start_codon:yes stop_codon:yes gene_type:complete